MKLLHRVKCTILVILLLISYKIVADPAIDVADYASLQRGAKVFFNYCAGCHSLQYTRYDSLAKGIKITDEEGTVFSKLVKQNLMFTDNDPLNTSVRAAVQVQDAEGWFGTAPPDLSLIARVRGEQWLYAYLRSFYYDPEKTWGVNNVTFPDVGMPHVLSDLQGIQVPQFDENGEVKYLVLREAGLLTAAEYDTLIADLVTFLSHVAEPMQLTRKRLGVWVLLFLGIFMVFSYLLKREYWKDIY